MKKQIRPHLIILAVLDYLIINKNIQSLILSSNIFSWILLNLEHF